MKTDARMLVERGGLGFDGQPPNLTIIEVPQAGRAPQGLGKGPWTAAVPTMYLTAAAAAAAAAQLVTTDPSRTLSVNRQPAVL